MTKREGRAEAVLELLSDISTVPDSLAEKIMSQKDEIILKKYLKLAARVDSIAEFVDKM